MAESVAELSKPVPPRGDGTDTSCRSLFHQEVMGPTRLSKPIPPRSDGTDTSCRSLFHQEVMGPTAGDDAIAEFFNRELSKPVPPRSKK